MTKIEWQFAVCKIIRKGNFFMREKVEYFEVRETLEKAMEDFMRMTLRDDGIYEVRSVPVFVNRD